MIHPLQIVVILCVAAGVENSFGALRPWAKVFECELIR